ncbi:glucosamine-6-phosphate deaminase [Geosporobacter ferrireducens]|uniref:Glucosamine-6-phosphate deaminase n=1 Tax=Geosporobacter ferrireducens TaxID=1424294 RepID=A0A1D8GHF4_9FIRM|nr:glucosamine-6-phosphate deaminase [Geosporobacter ferrireducens]AOT70320.1 glucosamine-6-phosphate deaminase [Geosporobacter ferrireducens]MTI54288.1 glucosamine-6-phosphate deaminase [Geosporobacter ferrireducens]
MNFVVVKDYHEMSKRAAVIVAGQIYLKSKSVIGFATGSTPMGMYRELISMYREEKLSFSEMITFNLDEYIGLAKENTNSYHYYMMENFFKHIDIEKENINMPNSNIEDIDKECRGYEKKIAETGGIDLQVLGIGKNGHIGFNEPNISFEATTHQVKLDEETILANSRFFTNIEDVPRYAISMGIQTIMFARKILLLANGKEKADALCKAVTGPITPDVPASILRLHKDVTVIMDEEASFL